MKKALLLVLVLVAVPALALASPTRQPPVAAVESAAILCAALSLPGEWAPAVSASVSLDGPVPSHPAPVLSPAQLSLPGEVIEDVLLGQETEVAPRPSATDGEVIARHDR